MSAEVRKQCDPLDGAANNRISNTDESIWYFAIAAMMNPTSMKNRHIVPFESRPGELLDFELGFFNHMGFAEAVPSPGKSIHGVVHLLDTDTMKRLDKLEISYVRTDGRVRLYDGSVIHATVYTKKEIDSIYAQVNNPPSQRYIEVMIEGAKHFGVDQKHIDFLKNHECNPRRLPHMFKSYGEVDTDAPLLVFEKDVKPFDGETSDILRLTVNGKVIEISPSKVNNPLFKKSLNFYKTYGQVAEIVLSNVSVTIQIFPS